MGRQGTAQGEKSELHGERSEWMLFEQKKVYTKKARVRNTLNWMEERSVLLMVHVYSDGILFMHALKLRRVFSRYYNAPGSLTMTAGIECFAAVIDQVDTPDWSHGLCDPSELYVGAREAGWP